MKEIIYNITQATEGRVVTFGVDEVFSKDNVLGIINKTQSKVLYTPVQAANIEDVIYNEGTLTIVLADNVPSIIAGDELFVKLYDTTELAKQGDDPNATLTTIYKLLKGSEPDTPEIIPEGVAERLALILEFFGIKPIQAYEFMTAEEVCSELEEIMTTMDMDLTPEKAKEITNNTLNKE